jgi:hypothetical protein
MGVDPVYTREDLIRFEPRHATFVGVDSDGCVFDTMERKQKLCFHGLIVSHWGLERIEPAVRASAEFINLHSCWRGQNRFLCLVRTFDLLRDHPEVRGSDVQLPALSGLRRWIESGQPLSNAVLKQRVETTGETDLASLFKWSEAVNAQIAQKVSQAPPFQWALPGLKLIRENSDAVCVSQTPTEALVREWRENGLLDFVALIAGQELGTKSEHLRLGAGGKYPADRILMIGDAPGDWQAARDNGAHFFPIYPGQEEASWEFFVREAYPRFLAGRYGGEYEDARIAEFQALLPDTPPWKRQ